MNSSPLNVATAANWPPEIGQFVTFKSMDTLKTGYVKLVQWGLVWRDIVLEDGRVIPEHKIIGCPETPVGWRNAQDVSQEEREAAEERLVTMSQAGLDPRDREQAFWAELNQYLAYTYLRFKDTGVENKDIDAMQNLREGRR
jgi:hypothetical protein